MSLNDLALENIPLKIIKSLGIFRSKKLLSAPKKFWKLKKITDCLKVIIYDHY